MAPQDNEPVTPQQPTDSAPVNPPRYPTPTETLQSSSPSAAPYIATSEPNGLTPIKPRSNRKKLFTIIAVAAVAVLGLGYGAYALWYNNPDKVTTDAFRTALVAKSATYKGKVEFKPAEGSSGTVTVDFDGQGDQENSQANLKINVDMAPMAFKVGTSFITTKAGDVYFKIDNAKTIMDTAAAFLGGTPEATTALQNVTDKLDNKWVKMTAADLKELNTSGDDQQTVCLQKAITDFQAKKSQQDQLFKTFKDNRFVKVDKQIGSETINGVRSNGYELGFDQNKAESFGKAAEQTDVFKALKKCVGDEVTNDATENSKDIKEGDKPKVEVWADQWNHNLTRVRVTSNSSESGSLTFNFEPQLNKPANVTIPTGNVTQFKDLKASVESIFPASMLAPSASSEAFDMPAESEFDLET